MCAYFLTFLLLLHIRLFFYYSWQSSINNCHFHSCIFCCCIIYQFTFVHFAFCNFRNGMTINWNGIRMTTVAWTRCTYPPSIYGCRILCSITSKCQTNFRQAHRLGICLRAIVANRAPFWKSESLAWSLLAICIIASNGRRYKSKPSCIAAALVGHLSGDD